METFLYALIAGAMIGIAAYIMGGLGAISNYIIGRSGVSLWVFGIAGLAALYVGVKAGWAPLTVIGWLLLLLAAFSFYERQSL